MTPSAPRLPTSLPALLWLLLPLCFELALSPPALADCRLARGGDGGGAADGTQRVAAEEAPGVFTWQARPGDELRCDADGFEPLDLWCGEGCGGEARVELLPARPLTVSAGDGAGELVVEWRRLGLPGEPSELLARRTVPLTDGGTSLDVASGDDRVIRLRAGDAPGVDGAPQTVFVPRGEEGSIAVLRWPEPQPGGEIFGFLETVPGEGEPALLYVQGVTVPSFRARLTLGAFGEFGVRGLAAGVYRPRAVYPGGAAAVGPDVEVLAGETTELIPWRVVEPEAPEPEPAVDEEAVATLVGTVRFAEDRPAADLKIEAVPLDAAGQAEESAAAERVNVQRPTAGAASHTTSHPTSHTSAAGRFAVTLPAAGWWQLRFSTARGFPVREQEVQLVAGENEQDFDLGAAAIRVGVVRDDGEPLDGPVVVELRRGREAELVRTGTLTATGERVAEVELLDLTFGIYHVSAYTESGWASVERALVQPSKNAPTARAEVVLSRSSRLAVVRMPDGSPATDVLVALDRRQLFPGRPGEYSLTGASQSSQIRIMPDPAYVAVCRRVGDLERIEIDLQPATAEAVLVPARDRMPRTGRYLGLLDGLPGSDCPMPIALQWQPFRDEHGRDRILLPGLVPGVYTLSPLGGESRQLVVPGPPVPLGAGASPTPDADTKTEN